MKILPVILLCIISFGINAQNVGINNANLSPDPSAGLDVNYTDKGILIPRVALTSTTNQAPIISPATSLLIYNTATVNDVFPGYYYWDGTQWVRILSGALPPSSTDWTITGNSGTSAGTNFIGTTDAQDLVFKTNGTENMRITNNNGYVGIGTATPGGPLHIYSTSSTTAQPILKIQRISSNSNGFIHFASGASAGDWNQLTSPGDKTLIFSNDNDPVNNASTGLLIAPWTNTGNPNPSSGIKIMENGNVGIATTPNNDALLHLQSSDKGVLIPQVALVAANNQAPVTAPTTGLLVYNTATSSSGNTAVTPGYYYWDGTRWQRFQTNAYAGMIQGVLNPASSSQQFVLNTAPPNWQCTNSYIDLPPGQWIVYITMLIPPASGSMPANSGSWIRTSLSESNSVFSYSGDIIGSSLASGAISSPALYGMVNGQIIINNTSGTTKRYYLWANNEDINYSAGFDNFGQGWWGENQFFALPAN